MLLDWTINNWFNLGLFEDPKDSSDIAYSAKEFVDILCFVPAFYGLHEPFLDNKAGCGFIGKHRSNQSIQDINEDLDCKKHMHYNLRVIFFTWNKV